MQTETRSTTVGNGGDVDQISSEDIEVRAIGDATRGAAAPAPRGPADTEQSIEYAEKRELAIDERENVDPARH